MLLCFCIINAKANSNQAGINNGMVIITANLKGTGFDYVPIDMLSYDFFNKKVYNYDSKEYDSVSGKFKGIIRISKPRLMLFFLKEVYVTPGDSINLKYIILKNTTETYKDTLIISGLNNANYQYFTFFRNEYKYADKNFPYFSLPFSKNKFSEFENQLNGYYSKVRKRFLKSLNAGNHTEEYKKFVLKSLYSYWVCDYLDAFTKAKMQLNSTAILSTIRGQLILNTDTSSHIFYTALVKLTEAFLPQGIRNYDLKEFMQIDKEASKYSLYLRDYLLTINLIKFIENKRTANTDLISALNRAFNKVVTPKYQQKITNYLHRLVISDEKINLTLDTIKLIDFSGSVTTFGKIVSNSLKYVIYIDFWASWCIPCRKETEPLRKLYETYKNQEIKYIQISLDTDSSKWKKAISKDNLGFSENYRFNNLEDSRKFSDELDYMLLPYYLLISRQGTITQRSAPRPSDSRLKGIIEKNLRN